MIYFNSDYTEGAHESILNALVRTNLEQTPGYGADDYCREAASRVRALCGNTAPDVHFLVGGTQTNATVISAALRGHQGVISADTGHIHVHETGAVEATGHKVLALPHQNGKITAEQVKHVWQVHHEDDSAEHCVEPKMVYISQPTEFGTLYSKEELKALYEVCRACGMYLFMDGARLGYGLAAADSTLDFASLAGLCDVFYIGGTKMGALFGEAVVIQNDDLKPAFRYYIKRHGGMLAKGRLLGLQFAELLKDDLYLSLGRHADELADLIRDALFQNEIPLVMENRTNQIFCLLTEKQLQQLSEQFVLSVQDKMPDGRRLVRICTSWATKKEHVQMLIEHLNTLSACAGSNVPEKQ